MKDTAPISQGIIAVAAGLTVAAEVAFIALALLQHLLGHGAGAFTQAFHGLTLLAERLALFAFTKGTGGAFHGAL